MRRYLFGENKNMRDLGGYCTIDNKETKFNRFIRSDLPLNMSDEEKNYLIKNNITTIIDLRNSDELLRKPNCLNAKSFNFYNIELNGGDFPNLEEDIPKGYLDIVDDIKKIKEIFNIILSSKGNVLFNCTAGKDRTGIISMLLLLIAKVPEVDIIADYEVSYTYIKELVIIMHELHQDWPAFVGNSKPEYMEQTLKLFKEKYSSIDNYLKILGFKKSDIKKLQNKLLD